MVRRNRVWQHSASALMAICATATAADVAFHDGTVLTDVRIIAQTSDFISVQMPSGMVRFPITVVKSIDGEPVLAAEETASNVPSQPDTVATASEPKPPENWIVEPELPVAEDSSVTQEERPAVSDAAEGARSGQQSVASQYRWNMEILLAGLLLIAGIWMRSLQWVQRDLDRRGQDPRKWSLIALALPGLGALLYAVGQALGAKFTQASRAGKKRKAEQSGRDSGAAAEAEPSTAARKTLVQMGLSPDIEKKISEPWKKPDEPSNEQISSEAGAAVHATATAVAVASLEDLGMTEAMVSACRSALASQRGLVLVVGPLGAGKTTSLYSLLHDVDPEGKAVATIEDPIEVELAGARQLSIDAKAGLTYETGVNLLLQDEKQTLLVGELSDGEAAAAAVHAAECGRLVLSSLQAKDAIESIGALEALGISRDRIANVLTVVIAQRLVRVLCPDCRTPYVSNGSELNSLGIAFEEGTHLYRAVGCPSCEGIGFRGYTGIFEMMVLDDETREAIRNNSPQSDLIQYAWQAGLRTYAYDGAEKATLGITMVDDILEVS